MYDFTIIKKDNKYFLSNEFYGPMMIYGVNSNTPYVKKFGGKVYLSGDMIVNLRKLQEA